MNGQPVINSDVTFRETLHRTTFNNESAILSRNYDRKCLMSNVHFIQCMMNQLERKCRKLSGRMFSTSDKLCNIKTTNIQNCAMIVKSNVACGWQIFFIASNLLFSALELV